ncbi:MAG: Glu/Leu/Phe/Val dehydrogenase [Firmicutes bacterium]|nr:Glu/Leu/Phe/Val dehydrogenase [Bacillota bacterium]
MELFEYLDRYQYEQVVFIHDRPSGLRGIIVIHDTTLGPALGGCRMWNYANEEEALIDALRLARGMTYKSAAAGLNLGGGKAVIMGDPKTGKSEALLRAFGRFVQGLGGRYITAEDVGVSVADMDIVHMETDFITGVSGGNSSGDPSPVTAYGVWHGIKACAHKAWGSDSLAGKTVALQGLGHVGYELAKLLKKDGVRLVVTDIDPERVHAVRAELGAEAVAPEDIWDVPCDIFSPCALGAVLNDDTIPRLRCQIVAGAANNQLREEKHGQMLKDRGILYAPDFIINAGGVINVADELEGYDRQRALRKAAGIYDRILQVFAIAERDGISTAVAADRLAEERIRMMKEVRSIYVHKERKPGL